MHPLEDKPPNGGLRGALHEMIFGVHTPAGAAFDIGLLVAILLSVTCVVLESVPRIEAEFGLLLRVAEWIFTIVFTIEYGLRLWTVAHTKSYALSFLGIVDLLALLPTYFSVIFSGSQSLAVVRGIRLLRVFRVLKLVRFVHEGLGLMSAIKASRQKIIVFVSAMLCTAVISGTLMYLIEGGGSGFTSIPTSVYWAVVTMTTVGYGDLSPSTTAGRLLSVVLMIIGYSLIVVPTGIVSAELARGDFGTPQPRERACSRCSVSGHPPDAVYCRVCGTPL
ncbi:MAG: ion transporter [Bryobacterales bacterium]|nr:ion transporter [Bryobacterales bacterium]